MITDSADPETLKPREENREVFYLHLLISRDICGNKIPEEATKRDLEQQKEI